MSLGSWVHSEYLNNTYFQNYVNSLSPILVPIASVGSGIASATIATLLYFTVRSGKRYQGLIDQNPTSKRVPAKNLIRKIQVSSPRSEQAPGERKAELKSRLQPVGSHRSKLGADVSGRDDEEDSDPRTS